ncbi:MAG: hypothetical protein ACXVDD_14765, partial [Polyangia bacterium]
LRSLAVAVAALAGVAGCGEPAKMMPPPPDMARSGPLDHPPLWRLGHGSIPVQDTPQVWTVVWPGDEAIGAETADFLDWMLHSDYWKTSLAEYGVGFGASKGLIVMPTAAPAKIDDSELGLLAASLVANGTIANDPNTSVAFVPSTATKVTAGADTGCEIFAGYHSHGIGMGSVAYSVNLRCAGEAGEPIDQLTRVLSHEVAETVTDPAPRAGIVDQSPGQQEIGDLCEFGLDLPVDVPPDATHPTARRYWMQRQYSDARAADGTIDPCLPLAWDHPYWNVALDPPLISVASAGSTNPIPARLDVFAYGDVGVIKWFASSSADVQPASGEAHAGDTIELTITPPTAGLSAGDYVEVDILAEAQKGGSQMWFGYVSAR